MMIKAEKFKQKQIHYTFLERLATNHILKEIISQFKNKNV